MSGCTWMTSLGGVLEIGGFLVLILRLVQVQRREFGWSPVAKTIGIAQDITAALISTVRDEPAVELASVGRAIGFGWNVSEGYGAARAVNPSATLEERVTALEAELEAAREVLVATAKRADQRATQIQIQLDEAQSRLKAEIDRIEDARRDELRTSVKVEALATFAFILGVVLSVLASVVDC